MGLPGWHRVGVPGQLSPRREDLVQALLGGLYTRLELGIGSPPEFHEAGVVEGGFLEVARFIMQDREPLERRAELIGIPV